MARHRVAIAWLNLHGADSGRRGALRLSVWDLGRGRRRANIAFKGVAQWLEDLVADRVDVQFAGRDVRHRREYFGCGIELAQQRLLQALAQERA